MRHIIWPRRHILACLGGKEIKLMWGFNEMRNICCVAPGWLCLCTDMSLCCLPRPHNSVNDYPCSQRQEAEDRPVPLQNAADFPSYFVHNFLLFNNIFMLSSVRSWATRTFLLSRATCLCEARGYWWHEYRFLCLNSRSFLVPPILIAPISVRNGSHGNNQLQTKLNLAGG